jgi:hypothetical protein
MIELLLACVLVLALTVVAWRSWRRRAADRALPGRSPATAIPVEDYSDIDVAIRRQTCPCGSRFVLRGEGPVRGHNTTLRMTRIECRRCARVRVLYFDLRTVRH